ncbi:MAG: hypothetical protein ACFFEK_07820 [Candidatus Thorarchaeota archaeon]
MANLKISIEKATLMVMNIEGRDGTIGFKIGVAAHVLRNNGGTRLSIYVHDKRRSRF